MMNGLRRGAPVNMVMSRHVSNGLHVRTYSSNQLASNLDLASAKRSENHKPSRLSDAFDKTPCLVSASKVTSYLQKVQVYR